MVPFRWCNQPCTPCASWEERKVVLKAAGQIAESLEVATVDRGGQVETRGPKKGQFKMEGQVCLMVFVWQAKPYEQNIKNAAIFIENGGARDCLSK